MEQTQNRFTAGRALLLLLLPLTACQSLAPPRLDPEIGRQTSKAHRGAIEIVAQAEAGLFAAPASFDGAADRYAALDSQLAAARTRAQTQRSRAARLLPRQIEGCRTEIERLARIHRRAGLAPGAGLTANAAAACDLAARAADPEGTDR